MIGQAISGKRYNLIILAGGKGSRMGDSSAYIPKALAPVGTQRAIDWIIQKHENIAERIIVGTGTHGDLLANYLIGKKYPNLYFSDEKEIKNNAISAMCSLDFADSRIPTIVTFCDLLIMDLVEIKGDMAFYVDGKTDGNVGTFRHSVVPKNVIVENGKPLPPTECDGVLGYFVFDDTIKLKKIVYHIGILAKDFTNDVVIPYGLKPYYCSKVYEFGTENDLNKVRAMWERSL